MHLHFGLHRGPYLQITPSTRLRLLEALRKSDANQAAAPEFTVRSDGVAEIRIAGDKGPRCVSLLVQPSSPPEADRKPALLMDWCVGYGDQAKLAEWLKPSEWLSRRLSRPATGRAAVGKP